MVEKKLNVKPVFAKASNFAKATSDRSAGSAFNVQRAWPRSPDRPNRPFAAGP